MSEVAWSRCDLLCPCEYGRCGQCANGSHEKCDQIRWPKVVECPAVYMKSGPGSSPIIGRLYEVGHRHRWICSCFTANHGREVAPIEPAVSPPVLNLAPVQLDLFEMSPA